jgi:Arc/MetJ-type ribon-helix-helix transcriptional regulator
MLKQIESEQVSARLTRREADQIDELVEMGFYLNRSDFIRQLVRKELGNLAVIESRQIPTNQARKLIEEYFEKHPVSYPSDVAADLGLDFGMVMEIVKKIKTDRILKEVETDDRA